MDFEGLTFFTALHKWAILLKRYEVLDQLESLRGQSTTYGCRGIELLGHLHGQVSILVIHTQRRNHHVFIVQHEDWIRILRHLHLKDWMVVDLCRDWVLPVKWIWIYVFVCIWHLRFLLWRLLTLPLNQLVFILWWSDSSKSGVGGRIYLRSYVGHRRRFLNESASTAHLSWTIDLVKIGRGCLPTSKLRFIACLILILVCAKTGLSVMVYWDRCCVSHWQRLVIYTSLHHVGVWLSKIVPQFSF